MTAVSTNPFNAFSVLPPGILTAIIVIAIVFYLLVTIPMFAMFLKAKTLMPWLAFIPIFNMIPYFRVIRVSMWNYLWMLFPVAGEVITFSLHNLLGTVIEFVLLIPFIVISIIWQVKLFRAFGMNPLWLLIYIGLIIPFIDLVSLVWLIVLLWMLGFGKKYTYQY